MSLGLKAMSEREFRKIHFLFKIACSLFTLEETECVIIAPNPVIYT